MEEFIRYKFNPNNKELKEALKFVQQYIIKTNSILVGGMALDSALQLKGSRIYDPATTIPDYDFFHYDSVNNAYNLVELLTKRGFTNVDVVRAVHTTTMRVRVNWVVVADMTYIPKELFDKISTLEFKGMRIIHPAYTMMDQLDSLSRPYINPPMEVASHRWSKDLKRLALINKYYAFDTCSGSASSKLNNSLSNFTASSLDYEFCKNFTDILSSFKTPVVSGLSGLAFLIDDKKCPIKYDPTTDSFKTVSKDLARITLLIGDADSNWWKNLKIHSFAKNANKITWFNESLNYPYRVELSFDDYVLELVYFGFNCLTYVDIPIIKANKLVVKTHPLVGCLWTIVTRGLLYPNTTTNNTLQIADTVLKTYLFTKESGPNNISFDKRLSTTVVKTGPLINHSLRLTLEYHHLKKERKKLKNKNNIYVPTSWNINNTPRPSKFDYSKSYYFTVLNTKPIPSTKFINSITSLEILSQYLEL